MPTRQIKADLVALADVIQKGDLPNSQQLLHKLQASGHDLPEILEPVQDWIQGEKPVGKGSRHRALLAVNDARHRIAESFDLLESDRPE